MYFKRSLISLFLLCLTSCDPIKDDFFYFIFGTDEISLHRVCSDNPSIFGEGRFIEIYSISETDIVKIIKSINNSSFDGSKYPKYEYPIWQQTPVSKNDSILEFVHSEMSEEKNACFDESYIKEILYKKGNYYLPLRDTLGNIRLFILDTKSSKLFLLTSYIL